MPKKVKIAVALCLVILLADCKKKDNPPQNVATNCVHSNAVNVIVNLAILSGSAQFFPLNNIGGSIYVDGYGLKGIVVYRASQNQFVAFERSCPHDGCSNAKAKVWLHLSNTALRDSVCGSVFNITDGTIQQAPATVGLYAYKTAWDGNQLQIYN